MYIFNKTSQIIPKGLVVTTFPPLYSPLACTFPLVSIGFDTHLIVASADQTLDPISCTATTTDRLQTPLIALCLI